MPQVFGFRFKPLSFKLETNHYHSKETLEITSRIECSRLLFVDVHIRWARGSSILSLPYGDIQDARISSLVLHKFRQPCGSCFWGGFPLVQALYSKRFQLILAF